MDEASSEAMQKEHFKCPVCYSANILQKKKFEPHNLKQCKDCGVIFESHIPTNEELEKHYSAYSYSSRKPVSQATQKSFSDLLDKFEPYRQTNNLLDVGCGQGDFLIAAKARGWDVYGSEYSPAAVKLCEDSGITMHQGEFLQHTFDGLSVDILTSFEVLEHTNTPHALLKDPLMRLRSGGLFYLTTPNFNSILRHLEKNRFRILGYPEHLVIYTPKSLEQLLKEYPIHRQLVITTGLDITRLNAVFFRRKSKSDTSFDARQNMADNESIRDLVSSGKGATLKAGINRLLTFSGTGDTLKAFYVKN